MPKYIVSWTEEDWYNVTIDAPSKLVALDKFYNQEYDSEEVVLVGSELQDSVEVDEV